MKSLASWSWFLPAALACVLGGCGGPPPSFPYFYAWVKAEWPSEADSAASLGYWVEVSVTKKLDDNDDCTTMPASTRVVINEAEATFAPDSAAGCLEAEVRLGPFLQNQSVSIVVEQHGEVVGEATFGPLMPGTSAILVSPTDAQVRTDADIVVRPVPGLPTSWGTAYFYPLDGADWEALGLYGQTERLLDGVHVHAPAFAGRAWLTIRTPDDALAEVSCVGFAACHGEAAGLLGPFLVTESP
jgi:hypothetical protein